MTRHRTPMDVGIPGVAIRLDLSVLNREGRRGGRPGAPIGHHLASGRRAAGHCGWRRRSDLQEPGAGQGLRNSGRGGLLLREIPAHAEHHEPNFARESFMPLCGTTPYAHRGSRDRDVQGRLGDGAPSCDD